MDSPWILKHHYLSVWSHLTRRKKETGRRRKKESKPLDDCLQEELILVISENDELVCPFLRSGCS
jgi:hypothetical protein